MRRALLASVFLGVSLGSLALLPATARAQAESREGIMLQNQILQLRQEMEQLRARGGGGGYAAPALPPPSRGGSGGSGGSELIAPLLDRVNSLEDEVRRLRGRADEAEFRNKAQQAQIEKLQGDLDYRLGQLEQGGGAAGGQRPAAAPAPAGGSLGTPSPAAPAAARPAAPATPAPTANTQEAKLQQGDDLLAKRDFQNAALAYDDAYRRNRTSARAPEALIGLASAFNGFGAKNEACQTLNQVNSEFPRLSASLSQRATQARQRAGCR